MHREVRPHAQGHATGTGFPTQPTWLQDLQSLGRACPRTGLWPFLRCPPGSTPQSVIAWGQGKPGLWTEDLLEASKQGCWNKCFKRMTPLTSLLKW